MKYYSNDEDSMSLQQTSSSRNWWLAIKNGLRGQCPACGVGALFYRYLKVQEECPHCGEALHHHRADDAPPYIAMTIVGHLIIIGLLFVERHYEPPMWIHVLLWLPSLLIMSLILLPIIKGAVVGLQWAHYMHGFAIGSEDSDEEI